MSELIGAVMGRSSNETDDSYSITTQIEAGVAYAASHGITIPEQYRFREDFTGKVIDRPELTKIRHLIRTHQIQALIVYATDRLARRVSVGEILLDEMFDHNVQLHIVMWGAAVRETPEDRLRFNFETTFSGFEREKIIERTQRGKRKKASEGKLIANNRPPFGYSINGQKTNFVINEYAPIVREILLLYGMEQTNTLKIVALMQQKGYKTPGMVYYEQRLAVYRAKLEANIITPEQYAEKEMRGLRLRGQDRWTEGVVYKILSNHQAYAGTYTIQFLGNTYDIRVPAIISQEEAAAVARMLATGRRKFARKTTYRTDMLMARRLTCAFHDYSYLGKHNQYGYTYYMCSSKRDRCPDPCTNPSVPGKVIDRLTREFITELLLNPAHLFAWWEAQRAEEVQQNEQIEAHLADVAARIEATTQKLHRTLDRLTDNLDDDEYTFYIQQRESLKSLLAEYREEYEIASKKRVVTQVDPMLIEDFATLGKVHEETLRTSTDFSFWRGLVDDLDIEGIIGIEGDRQYIDFVVFGRPRKRTYLDQEKGDVLSDASSNLRSSVLPCCSTRRA
jgi:site-specific DNA recombinase